MVLLEFAQQVLVFAEVHDEVFYHAAVKFVHFGRNHSNIINAALVYVFLLSLEVG